MQAFHFILAIKRIQDYLNVRDFGLLPQNMSDHILTLWLEGDQIFVITHKEKEDKNTDKTQQILVPNCLLSISFLFSLFNLVVTERLLCALF